ILILLVIFGTFPSTRGIASSIFSRLTSANSIESVTATVTPDANSVFNAKEETIWTIVDFSTLFDSVNLSSAPVVFQVFSQLYTLNFSVANHTVSDEEWGLSTASLYIPRAGCYFLMATWPEGGWIVFFSAGR